jgi:DNA-directed RNA polymerase specialized sigma subunit
MKLKELNAIKIIKMVLGDKRDPVKSEEELAQLLKKRMTKKELAVLHAKAENIDQKEIIASLKIDTSRYENLGRSAIKKLRNESVHGDFFYEKRIINEENNLFVG